MLTILRVNEAALCNNFALLAKQCTT